MLSNRDPLGLAIPLRLGLKITTTLEAQRKRETASGIVSVSVVNASC